MVKLRALTALTEPLQASQVPIRDVAIDAVNAITRSANRGEIALAAVRGRAGRGRQPERRGASGGH